MTRYEAALNQLLKLAIEESKWKFSGTLTSARNSSGQTMYFLSMPGHTVILPYVRMEAYLLAVLDMVRWCFVVFPPVKPELADKNDAVLLDKNDAPLEPGGTP